MPTTKEKLKEIHQKIDKKYGNRVACDIIRNRNILVKRNYFSARKFISDNNKMFKKGAKKM